MNLVYCPFSLFFNFLFLLLFLTSLEIPANIWLGLKNSLLKNALYTTPLQQMNSCSHIRALKIHKILEKCKEGWRERSVTAAMPLNLFDIPDEMYHVFLLLFFLYCSHIVQLSHELLFTWSHYFYLAFKNSWVYQISEYLYDIILNSLYCSHIEQLTLRNCSLININFYFANKDSWVYPLTQTIQ